MTEETRSTGQTAITSEARFDILRNDIAIELGVIVGLLAIADTFLNLSYDKEAADTINKTKAHVRRAIELSNRLVQDRQDAAAAGEAAIEYRAQRGRGVAA